MLYSVPGQGETLEIRSILLLGRDGAKNFAQVDFSEEKQSYSCTIYVNVTLLLISFDPL